MSQSGIVDIKSGFTGHDEDLTTGLVYAHARYYDPQYARFTTLDPATRDIAFNRFKDVYGIPREQLLLDPQQLNFYSYVRNNPVNGVDLRGTNVLTDFIYNNTKFQRDRYNAIIQSINEGSWQPLLSKLNEQADNLFPQVGDSNEVATDKTIYLVMSFSGTPRGVFGNESVRIQAQLLEGVINPKLQNIIKSFFKPTDNYPLGSIGATVLEEIYSISVGNKNHLEKVNNILNGLVKIINNSKSTETDIKIAKILESKIKAGLKIIRNKQK